MTAADVPTQLLFIVGMHRSGTSALCAALAASGVSFGEGLIDAMAGVNEEGFWEDAELVDINEELLALTACSWYAPAPDITSVDWGSDHFDEPRQRARRRLQRGFGDAPKQAIKDPRLCLTLPFWQGLCNELQIPTRTCVIARAPLEVAQSLQSRDGFPIGYGLRLFAQYRRCIAQFAPSDTVYVRFDHLLSDATSALSALSQALSLNTSGAVDSAIRNDLRHHCAQEQASLLTVADDGVLDLSAFNVELERHYPVDATLSAFAVVLATRGKELADIGREHSDALATLDQRDQDIEALSAEHRAALQTIDQRDVEIKSLSAEHRVALATIDERDEQIQEFDRRLSKLGDEHSHALEVLRQRDAELAWIKQRLDRVSKIPGVGYLIRRLRNHAQG